MAREEAPHAEAAALRGMAALSCLSSALSCRTARVSARNLPVESAAGTRCSSCVASGIADCHDEGSILHRDPVVDQTGEVAWGCRWPEQTIVSAG